MRLARAAGILEGEGYFALRANGTTPVIRCQMTDEDTVKELFDLFGGRVYSYPPQQVHHKPSWLWQLQGEQARQVMVDLRPFLFERRGAAVDAVLRVAGPLHEARVLREEALVKAVEAYRSGQGTIRKVAADHNVAYSTLKRRLAGPQLNNMRACRN